MKRFLYIVLLLAMMPGFLSARKRSGKRSAVPVAVAPRLSESDQQLFDALYFEALSKQLQNKPDDAFMLINEALKIDSLSAPAHFFRGNRYAEMGKEKTAVRDLTAAYRLDTTNFTYGMTLGEVLAENGVFESAFGLGAIQVMESMHRQHPTKVGPCYNLAEFYLRTGRNEDCLEILNKIEELDGLNPNITLQKFYILKDIGRTEDAFNEFDKIIKRYPYDLTYRIRLGDLQMQSGMIHEAKKTYDEAARIDPDNAYLWIAQSNYYSITGNQSAADTLVQAALVNMNLDVETKIKILTEYLKTSLSKVAKEKETTQDTTSIEVPGVDELFQLVAKQHPTEPEVYKLHADYLAAIGKDSLATVQMQYAVDMNPTDKDNWSRLFGYASSCYDTQTLIAKANQALALIPGLTDAYMLKAFAYTKDEKTDSVIISYREAIETIAPNEVNRISQIWGYLGDAYHQNNDTLAAYECYDKALKYNDRNYMVLNNYAYFLCTDEAHMDLAKAERMAAKVVQKYPNNDTYLDTYAWILYLQGQYQLAKFYQTKAMENAGESASKDLVEHYNAILKACEE